MKLKLGVKLTDLTPQMMLGALIVNDVFWKHSTECIITSANDSTHSATSWHYKGRALDFRVHNYAGDKVALAAEIKADLGPNFDVVLEALGTGNEHLHVEYDPKG